MPLWKFQLSMSPLTWSNLNKPDYLHFSQEASLKRRVRRNVKAPKAVAGLSYTELLAKKQQKPEVSLSLHENFGKFE